MPLALDLLGVVILRILGSVFHFLAILRGLRHALRVVVVLIVVCRLLIIISRVELGPCGIRISGRCRCPISLTIVAIVGPRVVLPGRSCCGGRGTYIPHHSILRFHKLVVSVIGVLWSHRQLRELRNFLPLYGLWDLVHWYLLLIGVYSISLDRHRLFVCIVKVSENNPILSLSVRRWVLAWYPPWGRELSLSYGWFGL